ncbi:mitochondrial carrier domain-containing protein [Geopyxis carbonaria]|nr:mitochondrial carrier domain-containing protein [Geopyxis carbonaria]
MLPQSTGPDSERASEERLASLFKKLDTRNEGHLDLEGFRRGLRRINHPLKDADHLIHDILTAVDTSKDGLIQFSEFRSFFASAERELWRIFRSVDVDGNGRIDKAELRSSLDRAGIVVDPGRLEEFFGSIDKNNDGEISFEEWRDFLMFMPQGASMKTIYSYYLSTVNVNPEGDVNLSDGLNMQGLGYFFAGGFAGVLSRTATAPFDRIKVYLMAQTGKAPQQALEAAIRGQAAAATTKVAGPFKEAVLTLWRAGGIPSFFAGNGLNVVKVLPESAIRFGSFEAAKRAMARLEGVEDVSQISQLSRFCAGGIGGVVSQFSIYPIDTLKFRMQCEMIGGGSRGNKLIVETLKKTWMNGGIHSFYRGLPLALIGIFPYSAIDLGTFELVKQTYLKRRAEKMKCKPEDVLMPQWLILGIGATSGSFGASIVYPINLLRTRLQAQGTTHHPQTYTGMVDVTVKTYRAEGIRGMFRGLTPNLMKVIPAVSISYLAYENTKRAMGLP